MVSPFSFFYWNLRYYYQNSDVKYNILQVQEQIDIKGSIVSSKVAGPLS